MSSLSFVREVIISIRRFQIDALIGKWLRPAGYRAVLAGAVAGALLAGGGLLVYVTGGTYNVWVHVMYLPVVLASAVFQVPGGLAAGLGAGLIVGPLMPLHAASQTPQVLSAWLFRTVFFVLVGLFSGVLFKWLKQQLDYIRRHALYDLPTGLPNLQSLLETLRQCAAAAPKTPCRMLLAIVDVANARELVNTLGYRSGPVIARQIIARFGRDDHLPALELFNLPGSRFAVTGRNMALEALKEIGAIITIDDFGEGHSTISMLGRMPIDCIKIDQKFIRDLTTSKLSYTIVRRLLQVTRDLDINTVAEGVETEEIFRQLGQLGCDLAQGYYISRPLSADDFTRWLEQSPWQSDKPASI